MKRALGKPSHRSGSVAGVSTGATTLRPFTFSKMRLTGTPRFLPMRYPMPPETDGVTEEESGLSSKVSADLSHLGTIIVKAHRAKPWSTLPYIDKSRTSPSELPAVCEKSKKAVSHCIRLELPPLPSSHLPLLTLRCSIPHQPGCPADAEISASCSWSRAPRQIPRCHIRIPIRI